MSDDAASFAEFYRASKDDCLRTVVASTGDRHAAEDAVAEAFARAWAAWRTVSQHPAPRAWVVRTALNANVSWWRRRRRETLVPGEDLAAAGEPGTGLAAGRLAAGTGPPGPDGGELTDGPDVQAIMTVLRRLPSRQREVVALRIYLDLDIAQTASVLGIAAGSVRAHLARAMAALRAELRPGDPPGSRTAGPATGRSARPAGMLAAGPADQQEVMR